MEQISYLQNFDIKFVFYPHDHGLYQNISITPFSILGYCTQGHPRESDHGEQVQCTTSSPKFQEIK